MFVCRDMILQLVLFLAHLTFQQTEAVRVRMGNCPGPLVPCHSFDEWIKRQREKGKCHPSSTPKLKCSLGAVPTSNGFQVWKPGQPCEAYYEQKVCTMMNTHPGSMPSLTYGKATDGGKCIEPKLNVQDCRKLEDVTNDGDNEALVDAVLDIKGKGPEEWVWLPSSRMALKATAEILANMIMESVDSSGNVIVEETTEESLPLWHTMLFFCEASKQVYVEQAIRSGSRVESSILKYQAASKALEECTEVTNLDIFAQYHPAWVVLQKNFDGYNDLAALKRIGALDLDESLWRQLAVLSGGDADETAKKVTSKLCELLTKAGDRGEEELELALDLSKMPSLSSCEPPIGGSRRLMEMRVFRKLKSAVDETVKKTMLEDALDAAASLLTHGEVEWVTEFGETHQAAKRKLEAWGLEEACAESGLPYPCTHEEIDAKACTDLQLPSTCSEHDREAARLQMQKCLELILPKNCTSKDIEEKHSFMRKCVEWGLNEMCTQADIWNAKALQAKCMEFGFPKDCTQDQVTLAARCVYAGLPHTCTQEDLEALVPTTTTTTLSHCLITERIQSFAFGVKFGFSAQRCNRVVCNPTRFFENDFNRFVNATVEGKKCVCTVLADNAHSFNYTNWYGNCGAKGCWQEYARDMMHAKNITLRATWQRLDSSDHWKGQCVQEEDAITRFPPARNAAL